jgi:hypothetical protein
MQCHGTHLRIEVAWTARHYGARGAFGQAGKLHCFEVSVSQLRPTQAFVLIAMMFEFPRLIAGRRGASVRQIFPA